MNNDFGTMLQTLRNSRGLSLREFCRQADAHPGNVSKIERGLESPPVRQEILERYAAALGLNFAEGRNRYQQFMDLAAIGAGRIPADILEDSRMPVLMQCVFAAMRHDPKASVGEIISPAVAEYQQPE